ncbi:rho GTPase-activating protein 27 isoform X2 [Sinocyclocheilus anshuiensis]|uniref:rho GTPase-activating protein 27 isoform X2 n=1 Tax=Sinocyclocheilus anshuiensis TaxID=1608454 RepID=UPI0007B7AE39|nr:PREDICTED: rho GTPase-activating protein 27-like isoform X2 [Sinocyclocheilus anshuiensis]
MTSLHSLGLVLVEFEYEYEGRDGHMVSIKPNERYVLLAKTNNHWWHVCKDERAKPFYIPAKYVKELPANIPSPLDFREPPGPAVKPVVPDLAETHKSDEVTIRHHSKGNYHKTENRMSTFGVPLDLHEPPSYKHGGPSDSLISLNTVSASDSSNQKKRMSQATNLLFGSRIEMVPDKFRVPSFSPADPLHKPIPVKPVELPVIKNLNETKPHMKSPEPEYQKEPESESSSSEPLPSPDSENIYESISDLNLDLSTLTDKAPAGLPNPQTNTSCSPPTIKAENDPTTAVYANVTDLKKTVPHPSNSSASTCLSPGNTLSPAPDSASPTNSDGWQVHTDHDSSKEYFYNPETGQSSWSDPRSPPAGAGMESVTSPIPVSTPSSAHSLGSDWEQLLDESTGRHYYYNHILKQTSWTAPESSQPPSSTDRAHSHGKEANEPPPLPEEDYPTNQPEDSHISLQLPKDFQLPQIKRAIIPRVAVDTYKDVPVGWTDSVGADGKSVFTNELTHEQWIQSKDDKGKMYYYLKDGSKCQRTLPEASVPPGQPISGNGIDQDAHPVLNNWRHTQFNVSQEDLKFSPSHRRIASDNASDASSSGNSPESLHYDKKLRRRRNLSSHSTDSHSHSHHSSLEKAGILYKTKVAENGKRLRKNWAQSWTVLHDGILTFHKDPKFTPAGMSTKTNQIVPEYTVELKGATLSWASKEKSSKKNVLELKTRHGSEYLIQYDTDSIIHDWHKIILDTIRMLQDHNHYSEDEVEDIPEKPPLPADKERKSESTRLSSSSSIDLEQGRVRTKLRKFLQRRPTLQSVKEKGYIKENVFGCHLDTLCHRENKTVPKFMEKCIRSIEKRGLKIDGIYRVNGNLAVIQKLRYKADHEEDLDLEDGQWEEIHVITGALKLFLRELPEPLFPFSFFDRFIAAIQMSDYSQKVSYIRDLVRNLPLPNHDTMEVLFRHLRKVIEHGELNRMSVQSMAIVFGPTLLRPQEESNITMHMVFQNQIVELILNEFNELFQTK